MGRKIVIAMALGATAAMATFSCSKNSSDSGPVAEKSLYIATGQCNSGQGITTLSSTQSSRMVSKVGLTTKNADIFFDLAAAYQGGYFAPETGAQGIVDNGSTLLLLTENATSPGERRIFSIPKVTPFNTVLYSSDTNAFTATAGHITRGMVLDADDTLLFSKSVSVEKLGTNTLRIPAGANAWIDNPGGTCGTSNTFVSAIALMPPFTGTTTGKVIFAHQGATAATNRIGIISQDGYSVVGDCLNGRTIQGTTFANDTGIAGSVITTNAVAGASPTAMVYIPTPGGATAGKLIVGLSAAVPGDLNNGTNLTYAIVMYDITETSAAVATISATATILYRDFSNIFGISAMAFDSASNTLYVATASQPGTANQATQAYGYKVEKFNVDLNATTVPKLTLVRGSNNEPFIDRSSLTKCISSMTVGN